MPKIQEPVATNVVRMLLSQDEGIIMDLVTSDKYFLFKTNFMRIEGRDRTRSKVNSKMAQETERRRQLVQMIAAEHEQSMRMESIAAQKEAGNLAMQEKMQRK